MLTGSNLQVIKSRHYIAHEGHEKEGDLKDIFGNKVEATNKLVIPRHSIEGYEERDEPYQHFDTNYLTMLALRSFRIR